MPDEEVKAEDVNVEVKDGGDKGDEPVNEEDPDKAMKDEAKEKEIQDKKNLKEAQANVPVILQKFDLAYQIRKLYDWNIILGGTLAEDEEADKLSDEFFNSTDEVKDLLSEIKKKQDKRNDMMKVQGRSVKVIGDTQEIEEFLNRGEELIDKLSDVLRDQSAEGRMSPEEFEKKEQTKEGFENLLGILVI